VRPSIKNQVGSMRTKRNLNLLGYYSACLLASVDLIKEDIGSVNKLKEWGLDFNDLLHLELAAGIISAPLIQHCAELGPANDTISN
jgi:hypothetical protein